MRTFCPVTLVATLLLADPKKRWPPYYLLITLCKRSDALLVLKKCLFFLGLNQNQ